MPVTQSLRPSASSPRTHHVQRQAGDCSEEPKASRPRQHQRLSARGVGKKGPGRHPDGDGLYLLVTKTGSRSWVLRTVVRGSREDLGLGGYPLTSLAEAREQATALRKIARAGGDPRAARGRASTPDFKAAAKTVHEEYRPAWKNAKHADQWINTLTEYAFPALGALRVDEIRSEHIVKAVAPTWLLKPETARRVLQRIGTVLLWAKGRGFRADSPTDEIAAARKAMPPQNDTPQHYKALPYADVPDFLNRLRTFRANERIKLAFEFLILTALRTSEVLEAKWLEFSFEKRVWTVPAPRMKKKREHCVPLSDRCIELLTAARQLKEDTEGYVFPGTKAGRPFSNMVFEMVMRRMGVDATPHGFRSSFRDWCAEQTSFPREVAEAALAHVVKDATEAAYMRSTFFEKRREMMSEWMRYATKRSRDDGHVKLKDDSRR